MKVTFAIYTFQYAEKGKASGSYTHQQLVIACGDLWGAGFETTVTALRMTFHFMVDSLGLNLNVLISC